MAKDITLDASRKYPTVTLSSDNLTAIGSSTEYQGVSATKGVTNGKWYWEVTLDSGTRVDVAMIGVATADASLGGGTSANYITSHRLYMGLGRKYIGGSSYGSTYTNGDVISVLLDMDNGTIEFWKNGVSQGIAFTDLLNLGEVFPHIVVYAKGQITINFGKKPFKYNLPNNFYPYSGISAAKKILLKSNNKIYSLQSNEILPEIRMTSNTEPAPFIISASHQTDPAWRAFSDISKTSYWYANTAPPDGGHWIQIKLDKMRRFLGVDLSTNYAVSSNYYGLKNFKVLGSKDGVTFTELYSGVHPNQSTTIEYKFNKTDYYLYYRIQGDSYYGASFMLLTMINFKESAFNGIKQLPVVSKDNLFKYGSRSITIDSILVEKKYVLQDTVSTDTDGLRKQILNKKPLSIKME